MPYHPDLPWPQIHEFLLNIEETDQPKILCYQAVMELKRLIPYDTAYILFFDQRFQVRDYQVFGVPDKNIRDFLDYYIMIDPCRQKTAPGAKTWRLDWNEFNDTEFQTDFGRRADIYFTASMYLHNQERKPGAILFTTRSGHQGFNDREFAVWEAVQPHLSNHFSITEKLVSKSKAWEVPLALPDSNRNLNIHPMELAKYCRLLSKREAEVANLLCQRLTVPEIASKLMISPHTVRTYQENIKEKLNVKNRRELMTKLIQGVNTAKR